MMKQLQRPLLAAAAFVAIAGVAAPAWADAVATGPIQAQYDAQCKDYLAKDFDAMAKTFSPDYLSTDVNGTTETSAQTIADVQKPLPAGIAITACAVTLGPATAAGNIVTLNVTQTLDGTAQTPDGKAVPLHVRSDSTDTWNVAGPVPLVLTSKEIGEITTVGGQVVKQEGTIPSPAPQ